VTDDDTPITLDAACKLWPEAKLKVSTLRAEAGRGRLDIFRLGRRDMTTVAAMKRMVRLCQDEGRRRASISTLPDANGLSETGRATSARAALSTTVTALKRGLPRISGKNTSRRPDQRH
jgi:hypothetical protein